MEYGALIIPFLFGIILYVYFKKEIVWWELIIPAASSLLFILIFKFSVKTYMVSDTEYWGNQIVKAEYYEYWETWITKTCAYDCNCTTDKDGRTSCQTCYRDCSYCDENSAYWVAVDENGNTFSITEEYYNKLMKKWSATPKFVELNRDIDYSGGCGKDGDMYYIEWNGKIETSETCVTEHTYTNKVQASHSAFKLPYISKAEADSLRLYHYPGYYDFYKQRCVLGLEKLYNADSLYYYETLFQYINGHFGPINKVKLFVLLFYNQPYDITYKQEAFWDGGNQNELVVNISMDPKTRKIQWVRAFSWSDNKRIIVDLREDISNLRTFQPAQVYNVIVKSLNGDLHKDFQKDFNYLQVDLPTWAMWVLYIVTLIITMGTSIWAIGNGIENEDTKEPTRGWNRNYYQPYVPFWQKMKIKCLRAWVMFKEQLKKK